MEHRRTARGGCSCGHVHDILPDDSFEEEASPLSAELIAKLTALGLPSNASALRREAERRLRDVAALSGNDLPEVRTWPDRDDGWIVGVDRRHPDAGLTEVTTASGSTIEEAVARFAITLIETPVLPAPEPPGCPHLP